MAREENVVMVHEKIKGKGIATKTAFDKVWSKRGWKAAPKADQGITAPTSTPSTPSSSSS